jgi:hypothetical protein
MTDKDRSERPVAATLRDTFRGVFERALTNVSTGDGVVKIRLHAGSDLGPTGSGHTQDLLEPVDES